MPLDPGTTLGPYAVTVKIGEGGMGEVYRARDTKLDRDVALKVLPQAFTDDPDRLARFEREAKVLASLNHPNIGHIYGLEEAEGQKALVLELVEGPTLADRIAQRPIPVEEALPIAKQIAEALEAAHEQGVIHRDLKPANIKVRPDGTVKVLDFGLAKALDTTPEGDPSQSPTLTAAATQMGVILGTAAYMSPEQARGKPVDRRADIWAFGVVVYEMLTGARPFQGEDVSLTLASVMRSDVDVKTLPPDLPETLRTVLRRCLEKDPLQRIRDMGDVRLAMAGAFETAVSIPSEGAAVPQPQVWQRPGPAAFVAAALVAVTGLVVWSVTRPGPTEPRPLSQFALRTPPDGPVRMRGNDSEVAISPDGTRIVYGSTVGEAGSQLYLRQVGELDATPLRGGEGGYAPFFSPNGLWVGFEFGQQTLKKVSVLGGPAVTIAEGYSVRGISWGADDNIVFGDPSGLMRVPAGGGQPEPLTRVDPERGEIAHRWPDILPNGKGVLFTAWSGSDESSRLAVVSLETGAVTYLLPGGSFPRYSPTGHIVYGVGGTLRAVGFDPERLALTSNNATPVVEDVATKAEGAGNFSFSAKGSLVYVMGADAEGGAPRALVWVDREGREEPLDSPLLPYRTPHVSPDGRRVAVDVIDPDGGDIWIHDLSRGTEAILTTDPADDFAPLWTPDGERVVFTSTREGQVALLQKLADTPGDAEHLMTGGEGVRTIEAVDWSADGQELLFFRSTGLPADIGLLSMEGERASEMLIATEFEDAAPAISPDGGWIAYHSDETGQNEVYAQRFPGLGGKQIISTDGGVQPLWSPDGQELFYRGSRGMMAVLVETDPVFRPGDPEVLFEQQYYFDRFRARRTYDLAPDGRFLMVKESAAATDAEGPTAQIILVQNWFEELKRLVPVD